MTQYPSIPYPPLSNPVDPNAPSAPYSPVLYHVDADSRRFVSPITWRPPLMAQALPTIHLSAITIMHIRPYSGGVPLTIDDEALALIKVVDHNRNPLHLSYATPINNEYYEVIIDLIDRSDITYVGQGYMELMIDDKVILSDKCVIRAPLFPSNEQPPSPYGTIVNVTDGSITLSTTPTLYQLSPIPSDQTELNLTFTPSNTDNIHKLLFHSEAPSLVINVDGASISGHYTGPGWYCAMVEESGSVIAINLERLTDFTTESVYTVKGFNTILVEDEWPTYGRRDTLYIHTLTREARIWKNEDWWPVGSSEYKYAPKSDALPLPTGTASKGVEEKYAAGDHVHPFSIELTTNHLDTTFTTPTDTHVPSSKLVKDTLDQVKSDLEDEISSLSGGVDVALNGKVDKVEGKGLSTNDLTDALLETLEGSEQKYNKDLNFATPTNGRYPSTLAVSTALDQVRSDLEEDMTTLAGAINDTLSTKVDKVEGKGLSTNDLTNELLDVISGAEQQGNKVDTLLNPGAADYPSAIAVNAGLSTKVDKVAGKDLSTNDYTTEEKNKVATIDNKVDKVEGKGLSTNDLTDELVTTINGKVDKVEGKDLSTNDLTNDLVASINGSEQASNKATTLSTPDDTKYPSTLAVSTALDNKVDKVAGKGLSDNNYTTDEKNKLASALTSLPNATTDAKGIIELATEAEVTEGTLTDRAVVPSTLKTELDKKVDKVAGYSLSKNDLTDDRLATLNGSEQTSNKATTLDTPNNVKYPSTLAVSTALNSKVDKVPGKGLSTNDLTDELVTTINGKVDKVEGKGLSTNDLTDALVTTINSKVDKVEGKGLSTNDLTNELVITINGSEQASNKATNLASPNNIKYPSTLAVSNGLSTKVDKVTGKGLSDNNYTTEEKNKLASAITSLPTATTTAPGIVELATSAEVTQGSDSSRAVVPSTLKVELNKKVDKVEGKGLSTNDLTDALVTTINGSEQASNKATTLASPDNIKYPTTLVVSTALDDKVDKVEGKTLSTNDYTTEEKDKVATIQNETLTTINGTTAEIEPWSRSRWTLMGDCSLTLSDDWSATGMESAYILITLKTGATLSVPSTVVFDDYLDQGEGVYEVELINLDGVIHFRWTECYPVASIKFYVTTTAPNQTYTINALGVSASTDVGWGDGSLNTYTGEVARTHVYATPGTYEVRILPAENIVLLNLQGALVSEVNSEDLKAASNMEYLYLRGLTNATGVIDTAYMIDWPMTQYFYLYNNPLLSINIDSAHMVGWNPTTFCIYNPNNGNGNITINTENMAGWTNLETLILQTLSTLGGSLDTLHFAGWSNFRSITLYVLPTAFNVRFHTEDLVDMPIASLHLYDYDGRNTVIDTADLATKTMTYFRLYKLPLSVVTVNSADMTSWNLSYLMVTDLNQTTGTVDFADLAGCNIVSFGFIDCPLITFIVDQSAFLSWTSLALLQISNCTFSTEQMDETLYYLYTAAPTRTTTGGTISFGGTSSSAPSGVYEAPDCPVTSSTPGRGIAYALKNDSCSVGFNKWATVTIK